MPQRMLKFKHKAFRETLSRCSLPLKSCDGASWSRVPGGSQRGEHGIVKVGPFYPFQWISSAPHLAVVCVKDTKLLLLSCGIEEWFLVVAEMLGET